MYAVFNAGQRLLESEHSIQRKPAQRLIRRQRLHGMAIAEVLRDALVIE